MSVEAHDVVIVPRRRRRSDRDRPLPRHLRSRWAAVVVTAITLLWTIPTFGLFVTSLRPSEKSSYTGWWAVFSDHTVTLDNYVTVITGGDTLPGGIAPYLVNSIAVAVPATIIPIVLGAMAAYAIAWVPFRGATALLAGVIALQVVPIQMALLPLAQLFANGWSIGAFPVIPRIVDPSTGRSILSGTYAPLWIAHTMFALPFVIFVMHHFISRLPRELLDAAQVDGAGHVRMFRDIVAPLSMPAFASLAIFQFLWVWNDLIVALTYSTGSADVAPITAYLAYLKGGFGSQEYLLTAGAFVAMVVPLVVFFAFQRHFVRGLLTGSVDK
ncbi:MAG: carbohydrate ABC transporter permease [Candidatus Nanopelagicales bacterium]